MMHKMGPEQRPRTKSRVPGFPGSYSKKTGVHGGKLRQWIERRETQELMKTHATEEGF